MNLVPTHTRTGVAMRYLSLLLLTLVLLPGCKKAMDKLSQDTQVKPGEEFKNAQHALTRQQGAPSVHAPTGVVINSGGGGGSGGAVQAVRQAVVRTVNQHEMDTIHKFMEAASSVNGQLPTKQEVVQALQREAPKTYELINENVIILTGT